MLLKVFTSPTCGPCRLLKRELLKIHESQYPNLEIRYMDITTNEGVFDAQMNGVHSTPTMILSHDGSDKSFIVGFRPEKQIRDEIEKHLK